MPKRTDIKSILIIGSGPIVIGQACEFDYSGTQAVKALKDEGYKVILVNSNPATIMTDPEFADRTYIEPITPEFVEEIIRIERPDAVLPTMGGQTALNCTLDLHERGVFEKYGCQLIGANVDAIKTAEDRDLFKKAMEEIGLESAKSILVTSIAEAEKAVEELGLPLVLRPSRTLGGTGGGIVRTKEELPIKVQNALTASPNHEVLIEESLLGWKEMELEVMRDLKDNVVIVCGIENLDPMGIHTGDSITVAPIQTLTDKEYQLLRDASIKIIRRIGVDTGGSNVQFAIDPRTGRSIVIEMNPRVSRSSALASKATGFPIAKIAAKLAVGYTLDEISNDITKGTPACFEPSIDYVVVKIPRFNFEKFPFADRTLGTQMKSVGEALSFGRTFREALQKGMSSLEMDTFGFDRSKLSKDLGDNELLTACGDRLPERLWIVGEALRRGITVSEVHQSSSIDPWFLEEIKEVIDQEVELSTKNLAQLTPFDLLEYKREGFADRRLAKLLDCKESQVREKRNSNAIAPSYKAVDTCAAEFKANTPYLYSTYDSGDEMPPTNKEKIVILGAGPNRIGQGIEFDYCCVHAAMALREDGYETIMVNCNPETVSTDYDTSDRLYFEPLTIESVLEIVRREKPKGVIVQFGGQTPLRLSKELSELGVPIIGTSVDSIDMAEDRERFGALITKLGIKQPEAGNARSLEEALQVSKRIGFPLVIRPSFVLGGRAMRVVYHEDDLKSYMNEGVEVSHDRPVLLDRFLDPAIEVDVDAVSDGNEVVIAGVMEHVEPAGIHSGDSSCCLPPQTLPKKIIDQLKVYTENLAKALKVVGLINVQYAVDGKGEIYILEANPRASRTVPFVSKATGIPWAKVASRLMAGQTISDLKVRPKEPEGYYAIKASVFPFSKFPGSDTLLGPEMKSTGEVMGLHTKFGGAFAKAEVAAGIHLPRSGRVFLSVKDPDKEGAVDIARNLVELGFRIVATRGTASYLSGKGITVETINKVREGSPHAVDMLGAGDLQLIINSPDGWRPMMDSKTIRLVANELKIPTFTTLAQARAVVEALKLVQKREHVVVKAIQDYYQ